MNIYDWWVRLVNKSPIALLARKRGITQTKYKGLQEKGSNNT